MIEALLVILSLACLGLIFREFFPGYLREKGKNLATHKDIDRIVKQLRKTTEAAEAIKADIAGGLWVEQSRWTFRAEVYKTLLESLGDTASGLRQLMFIDEWRPKFKGDKAAEEYLDNMEKEYGPKCGAAFERLIRAASVAGIWLDAPAMKALEDLKIAWIKAHEGPPSATAFAAKCIAAAKVSMETLTEAAKADLQLMRTK